MNFDEIICRTGTASNKHDRVLDDFGVQDVIPLGIADADFRSPQAIRDALANASRNCIYGYTHADDEYYELLAGYMHRRYRIQTDKSNLVFCSRIVQGVAAIFQNYTAAGDKIGFLSPGYAPLRECALLNGRECVDIDLIYDGSAYQIDFNALEKAFAAGIKIFLFINPHNPSGRVWSVEELKQVAELCEAYQILLISDEIHADFIRQGFKFTSIAALKNVKMPKFILMSSPAKTFNIPGLQLAHALVRDKFLRNQVNTWFVKNGIHEPSYFALTAGKAAFQGQDAYIESINSYIEENYQYLKSALAKNTPQLKVIEREATYLAWINFSDSGLTRVQAWDWLINRARVGVSFGENFGRAGAGFFRLNMACPRSILQKAVEAVIANKP